MENIIRTTDCPEGLSPQDVQAALEALLTPMRGRLKKVLLLPPDYTRVYSGVGAITAQCYRMLSSICQVDVMPALGTHDPMSDAEALEMFEGAIAPEQLICHRWREDVVKLGEVPADHIRKVTEGLFDETIDVEVNRRLLDPSYDLILSLGQVIPHEVAGIANYSKNIFVGCGGSRMIHRVHLMSAAWGMRRVLGEENSVVRAIFDYAQENFLAQIPLVYLMTVSTPLDGVNRLRGLYIGQGRGLFGQAARQSAAININVVERSPRKVVAYMDEKEFKTTWVGNKAVYRSCMLIAPGGELVILAPGVRRFGEDMANDALIRKHGYRGTRQTLEAMESDPELAASGGVAAHLMHGSTDGVFTVTYAVQHISQAEIEGVGYRYQPLDEAMARYLPHGFLPDGFHHTEDGEEFYFLGHPAAGLWKAANA